MAQIQKMFLNDKVIIIYFRLNNLLKKISLKLSIDWLRKIILEKKDLQKNQNSSNLETNDFINNFLLILLIMYK